MSYLGKPHTSSNEEWHRPQSNGARVEEELMEHSHRALAATTDPLDKLRLLCLSRGAGGIMAMGRVFRRMYEEGIKQLNKEEFMHTMKKTGLELKETDVDELFEKYDTYDSGYINIDDFIRQIRPPMSESRIAMVERVFSKLDKTGEGTISIDDIRKVYSVKCDPRYMNGDETAELVMNRFLDSFDGVVDGKVTLEEFMNYYSGISVSIEDDCFFDLMMRQAFKL